MFTRFLSTAFITFSSSDFVVVLFIDEISGECDSIEDVGFVIDYEPSLSGRILTVDLIGQLLHFRSCSIAL